MSCTGSVTEWIGRLKTGDQAAAQQLWERYFRRLVGLARHKLRATPRRAADEEDVALSAFDSFCRGAERGRFPQLGDRDDLWPLLVVITARKASDLHEQERRHKRGRGQVLGEAALPGTDAEGHSALEQILSREPTPAFASQVAEECRRLLSSLGDADLQQIAGWKMEGYTLAEIAARLGCVPRTVRRRLQRIRTIWREAIGP
jgi:DNA-directed RNA polymerase specialized sigma24 family protein